MNHQADTLMLFMPTGDLVFKIAAFDSLLARALDPKTPNDIAEGLCLGVADLSRKIEVLARRVWRGANVRQVTVEMAEEVGMVRLTVVMGLMGVVKKDLWGVVMEVSELVPHRFVVEAPRLQEAVAALIPLRGKVAA